MTTDVEAKDRRTISLPVAISRKINMSYYQTHMAEDPEMLDSLERAGFAVDRSGDMVKCFLGDGAGGHHTDVGGGTRVLAGTVRISWLLSLTIQMFLLSLSQTLPFLSD